MNDNLNEKSIQNALGYAVHIKTCKDNKSNHVIQFYPVNLLNAAFGIP